MSQSPESEVRLIVPFALIELQLQSGDWQALVSSVNLKFDIHFGASRKVR